MSLLRRSLELGLGALLLSKEAAEDLFDNLAAGEPEADRRARAKELAERARRWCDDLAASLRTEADSAVARAGLVRRAEYEALVARVAVLEAAAAGPPAAPAFEPAPEL
ncbi:MAG: hypothetical protein HYU66_09410 [Armatimonadetes bacterium]|nr:hypothetical protein [Armatimonadota bacterium]